MPIIVELIFLLLAVILIGFVVTQFIIPIFTGRKILWLLRRDPLNALPREEQALQEEVVRSEVLDVQEKRASLMKDNLEREPAIRRLLGTLGRKRSHPEDPNQPANK